MKIRVLTPAAILMCSLSLSAQMEVDKTITLTGADGNRVITNLELPLNDNDAANKAYVDAAVAATGGGSSLPTMISDESASAMHLGDAIRYCNASTEGAYTDWRLPSYFELVATLSGATTVLNNSSSNYVHFVEYAGAFAASPVSAASSYRNRAIRLSDGALDLTYYSDNPLYKVRCVR